MKNYNKITITLRLILFGYLIGLSNNYGMDNQKTELKNQVILMTGGANYKILDKQIISKIPLLSSKLKQLPPLVDSAVIFTMIPTIKHSYFRSDAVDLLNTIGKKHPELLNIGSIDHVCLPQKKLKAGIAYLDTLDITLDHCVKMCDLLQCFGAQKSLLSLYCLKRFNENITDDTRQTTHVALIDQTNESLSKPKGYYNVVDLVIKQMISLQDYLAESTIECEKLDIQPTELFDFLNTIIQKCIHLFRYGFIDKIYLEKTNNFVDKLNIVPFGFFATIPNYTKKLTLEHFLFNISFKEKLLKFIIEKTLGLDWSLDSDPYVAVRAICSIGALSFITFERADLINYYDKKMLDYKSSEPNNTLNKCIKLRTFLKKTEIANIIIHEPKKTENPTAYKTENPTIHNTENIDQKIDQPTALNYFLQLTPYYVPIALIPLGGLLWWFLWFKR